MRPDWFSWLSSGSKWTKWHHRTTRSPNRTLCGRMPVSEHKPVDLATDLHPSQACAMCLTVLQSRNRTETHEQDSLGHPAH